MRWGKQIQYQEVVSLINRTFSVQRLQLDQCLASPCVKIILILTRKSLLPCGCAFLLSVQRRWLVQFSIWNFDMIFFTSLLTYKNLPELFNEGGWLRIMTEVIETWRGDTKLFLLWNCWLKSVRYIKHWLPRPTSLSQSTFQCAPTKCCCCWWRKGEDAGAGFKGDDRNGEGKQLCCLLLVGFVLSSHSSLLSQ